MTNPKFRPLTPRQEAEARNQAYAAFMSEQSAKHPRPEPSTKDLVHENPAVVRALVGSISLMPIFLAVIMVSAMVISADKSFKAFANAAAHQGTAWTAIVGSLGVVMTEGSVIFVAFAATRQRLQQGLPRRVTTLPSLLQGIKVRLGMAPVPDYDEIPDISLERYSKMVFVLVLAANIFTAVIPLLDAAGTVMTLADKLSLGFAVFMGAVAPFALHSVGSQLAQLSFDLYEQERERLKQELEQQWRAEIDAHWQLVEDELTRRALHRKYVVANGLEWVENSPYMLMAGEGVDDPVAVPLPVSQPSSPMSLQSE